MPLIHAIATFAAIAVIAAFLGALGWAISEAGGWEALVFVVGGTVVLGGAVIYLTEMFL